MTMILDGTAGVTFPNSTVQAAAGSYVNRIINGAMVIDQRANGASTTVGSGQTYYSVDRWRTDASAASKYSVQQNAGSVTPPAGYKYYLGITSASAYSLTASDNFWVLQNIEGYNINDLAWGTASAATVTISFWVRSSLTGTFSGTLTNNNDTQVYPFSYTISSANTWEQKSITIVGSTSGTWNSTNGLGLKVQFSLGLGTTYLGTLTNTWNAGTLYGPTGQVNLVATSGATFYLTGVQLEKSAAPSNFDYRAYSTELAMCQRYYTKLTSFSGVYVPYGQGSSYSTTSAFIYIALPVQMRTTVVISQSTTALYNQSFIAVTSLGSIYSGSNTIGINVNVAGGLSVNSTYTWLANNSTASYVDFNAEL